MPIAKKSKNLTKPARKTVITSGKSKKATAKTSRTPQQLAIQNSTLGDPIFVEDIKRKHRADSYIPSEIKQCLLTGKLDTEATIGTCYLLNEHHWRNNKWLARLEWWWGLKYNSLQLDTESNRLYLRQDWLRSFISGQWILLPAFDVLWRISLHYGRHSSLPKDADKPPLEDIYSPAETFEYRLVPLHSNLPFIRTGRPMGPTSRTKTMPSHHSYPFDTLPTLVSRVKPHFIICDAGQKLAHTLRSAMPPIVSSIYGIDEILAQGMLNMVLESYILWGSQRPPPRFALSPRTPPRMPVTTMASGTPVSCDGPCFYSRYEWSVHRRSRCKASSLLCRFRPRGSTDLDTCDEFLSHDGTDGGEGSPQHERYRKNVVQHVGKWLVTCIAQVEKRGWTPDDSDDNQVEGYAQNSLWKRQRTS